MFHFFFLLGKSGKSYVNNYEEQPYQTNQFNVLYEKDPLIPYGTYNQVHQPQYSLGSIDSYVTPNKLNIPYSTTIKPQVSYGSTDNYVTPKTLQFYNSAQSYAPPNPQIAYASPETYVNPNKPQFFYSSTEGYPTSIKPQYSYSSTETYATTEKPEYGPYGPSESYYTTSKPQLFYSSTASYPSSSAPQYSYSSTETYATTKKPEYAYGSYGPSESYSTTSKPQFFYSSTNGYPSSNKPQYSYSSTENYATTSKPQFSYGPFGPSESYSTTIKPQFAYNAPNTYIIPNQPGRSPNFDFNSYRPIYNQFDGPLGILYHQKHESEIGPQYQNGILLHQQNNFQSIPINRNYDSHKNDVQYPPLKDFETYSTTKGSVNKIPSLYSESYSPSNVYLNPSIPYANNEYKNTYSILGGTNGYDSHKVNEQYQPSYKFETYSTTQKPIIKLPEIPTYSQSNVYLKPTSKPFVEYLHESSQSNLNEKSQYSTTSLPYETRSSSPSSIGLNEYHISSTTPKPAFHDTSLYKEQFNSQFNFEDYLSRISNQQYQSTTPVVNYTPSINGNNYANSFAQTSSTYSSTTSKPTVFYYSSPSPTSTYKKTYDVPSYSTSPKVKEYTESYGSSSSYPVTTEKIIDYKLPISSTYASPLKYSPTVTPNAYTPTFKPTVNYYTPSSTVSNQDSIFVDELISKLSKTPISTTYSSSTPEPLYANYPLQQAGDYIIPNDSFNIDEYIANLYKSIGSSTQKPYSSTSYKPYAEPYSSNDYASQPLPTSVYLSPAEEPKTFDQESYSALPVQSTTCKPEASIKTSPKLQQYMPSLESVFSARPPVTYTQRPEPLAGYSSTASDLINYYHSIHSSLDSAYRSPFPRYYSAPAGNSLYTNNYTFPRDYEKDAGHNIHAAYPAYPLKPIVVEPVSPELNAEFERYYTAGIRKNLKSEENGKVFVVGDTNPLLVGKLGAQCDCAKKKKPTIVSTTTSTVIDSDEDEDDEKTLVVKEIETKTNVKLEEVKKPSGKKLCTRPGLFRDPKQCNKFYSCNWDKWTQKYELSEFKCPIHLAFDENLSACNWPSKGPACSHDTLINYAN